MAEKVPGWLERILLPQISEVKGELKAVNARIDGLDGEMNGEFKALHSEIRRLDDKIEGLDERLNAKIDGLDERLNSRIGGLEEEIDTRFAGLDQKIDGLEQRMDIVQRLAVVEGKVHELETRP